MEKFWEREISVIELMQMIVRNVYVNIKSWKGLKKLKVVWIKLCKVQQQQEIPNYLWISYQVRTELSHCQHSAFYSMSHIITPEQILYKEIVHIIPHKW